MERAFLKSLLCFVTKTVRLALGYILGAEPKSIRAPPRSAAIAHDCKSKGDTSSASFEILHRVSDVVHLIFGRLDSSSLALAACVCRAWRDAARIVRGSSARFRLRYTELLRVPTLLIWAVDHLGMRDLPEGMRLAACTLAARHGCLELAQWAQKKYHHRSWTVCAEAAKGGYLEILQWARASGCGWNWIVCSNAAEGGHLEVLRWARDNGCEWSQAVCDSAAEGGHFAVLQWARANGCVWNADSVCAAAAENGHLEILQWVRAVAACSGWQTCAYAAMSGRLKILQWARENGFAWNEKTCLYAAQNGHLDILQWARANDCPWDQDECLTEAQYCGQWVIAAWISNQPRRYWSAQPE